MRLRLRRPPRLLTPAGRGVVVLATAGELLGRLLGWDELLLLGRLAALLLVVGLVLVLLPRRASAVLEARPRTTTAGATAHVRLAVTGAGVPILPPLVEIGGVLAARQVRLPMLLPGRTHEEQTEVETSRRGIYPLGPVDQLRSDPAGLFLRRCRWGGTSELRVRPRVVVLDTVALGGVFDLEGLASDELSTSDLAFHALREYVPGDDLRHVHWRSSAKADTLLVRQYLESRTLRAVLVVDDRPSSYGDEEEFETAVSAIVSIGLRALLDGFEVRVGCGDVVADVAGPESILDLACSFTLAGTEDLTRRAELLTRTAASGFVCVATGSAAPEGALLAALARFPADSTRLGVRVAPGGTSYGRVSGITVVELGRLDQLPAVLAGVRA